MKKKRIKSDSSNTKKEQKCKNEDYDDIITTNRLHYCRGLMVRFIFLPETLSPGI